MRDIDYRIKELAKPHLNTRKNDIHVKLSYQFALTLLENEPEKKVIGGKLYA